MSPNDKQNPRRDNEPSAGYSSVPMWLILLLGLFFYWGMVYLDRNAGGFNPKVYHGWDNFYAVDEAQPKDANAMLARDGKKVFDSTCSLCHQPHGMGEIGKAPPLAGSEWVLCAQTRPHYSCRPRWFSRTSERQRHRNGILPWLPGKPRSTTIKSPQS